MDSGTLRLVLIAAGVLLLGGIYYFGQKKSQEEKPQANERHDEPSLEPTELADEQPWSATEENLGDELLEEPIEPLEEEMEPSLEADEFDAAIKPLDRDDQQELFAEELPDMAAIDNADLPQKILQIMIVAPGEPFPGETIVQAAEACGLQHGDMQIFHHNDAHSKYPLFSMASLVEPGNFPIDEMTTFTTPGLALFAQLPASKPGLEIYDEMVSTANKMAEALGGELRDSTHSVLSKQTIEHTRSEILEHQRQVQLASKRI
jgi:cell division protein ZipA